MSGTITEEHPVHEPIPMNWYDTVQPSLYSKQAFTPTIATKQPQDGITTFLQPEDTRTSGAKQGSPAIINGLDLVCYKSISLTVKSRPYVPRTNHHVDSLFHLEPPSHSTFSNEQSIIHKTMQQSISLGCQTWLLHLHFIF